jgi:hypothetical protein
MAVVGRDQKSKTITAEKPWKNPLHATSHLKSGWLLEIPERAQRSIGEILHHGHSFTPLRNQ